MLFNLAEQENPINKAINPAKCSIRDFLKKSLANGGIINLAPDTKILKTLIIITRCSSIISIVMANEEFDTIKQLLREFVKEYATKVGSFPEENYHEELLDDPAFAADSVYVPHDIKKKIKKWASDMGLSTSKINN